MTSAADFNGQPCTLAQLAAQKALPVDVLRSFGVHDLPQTGIGMWYYGLTAEDLFVRERGSPCCNAKKRFHQPEGTKLQPYGLWKLGLARREGRLFMPEGESDTWTFWHHSYPALGMPGSSSFNALQAEHVDAIEKIYICREPDDGGNAFLPGTVNRLKTLAFKGKAYELRMPDGIKDVSDLHVHDEERFAETLEECIAAAPCVYSGQSDNENKSAYQFVPMGSAAFFAADYKQHWLVQNLLVADQPCVVGGPKKSLKTSFLIALAIALASGTRFLGRFNVYRPVRVALLSGESGQFTVQETARRICKAVGIDPASLNILWDFKLPQLADAEQLDALRDGLQLNQVDVVIIDPAYLCLLAGIAAKDIQASNLYDMGPLLLGIANACLSVGCTPILVFHAKKTLTNPFQPLDLDDLSFSGIAEFARQWLLFSRRRAYEPGTGHHELWMLAGGSIGHGGSWGIDLEEGVLAEDFTGRKWEVSVISATDVRESQAGAGDALKAEKQARQDKKDDAALLSALDGLDRERQGLGYSKAKDASKLPTARMTRAVIRLVGAGIIEEIELEIATGKNLKVKKAVKGVRRRTSSQTERSDGSDGIFALTPDSPDN